MSSGVLPTLFAMVPIFSETPTVTLFIKDWFSVMVANSLVCKWSYNRQYEWTEILAVSLC